MSSRVLVVEDEPGVRLLLHRYLERVGFEAHCVDSAERALGLIRGGTEYDAYVVDLSLPGMSGLELAGIILQQSRTAGVLLTSGSPYDPAPFGDERVTFLRKPFLPKDLTAALQPYTGSPG